MNLSASPFAGASGTSTGSSNTCCPYFGWLPFPSRRPQHSRHRVAAGLECRVEPRLVAPAASQLLGGMKFRDRMAGTRATDRKERVYLLLALADEASW